MTQAVQQKGAVPSNADRIQGLPSSTTVPGSDAVSTQAGPGSFVAPASTEGSGVVEEGADIAGHKAAARLPVAGEG